MKIVKDSSSLEEKRKKRYLILGVSFFSGAIVILWGINLIGSFQPETVKIIPQDTSSWRENLKESVTSFQDSFTALNPSSDKVVDNQENEVDIESQLFLQGMAENLDQGDSDAFLQDLENKINNHSNCPEFINCMPSPDRVGTCSIPAGCEEITQIAY